MSLWGYAYKCGRSLRLSSLIKARESQRHLSTSASCCGSAGSVKMTCLYDFHIRNGGKMVEFGGWNMPVQYADLGIPASHLHTREAVSIFDVSHMMQTHITGQDRVEFIESLRVADVQGLSDNQGTLSVFTNSSGGIIDDLIINKTALGFLYVVSNAGCAEKDLKLLKVAHLASASPILYGWCGTVESIAGTHKCCFNLCHPVYMKAEADFKKVGRDVHVEVLNNALIAVQGPAMAEVLQPHVSIDLKKLPFMTTSVATVFDVPNCRITRCGYTGEDGVEISIPTPKAEQVTKALLNSSSKVKLAGLGARGSLRLEAALCLYGNDIDDKTTPIEATLAWTIGKRRRQEANFPGAEKILKQLKEKPTKKRVGLVSVGPPARGGTLIVDEVGKTVGRVTSGCPSPTMKKNIAMGYVDQAKSANGTTLQLMVRNKAVQAEIVKMPFVPTRYYFVK